MHKNSEIQNDEIVRFNPNFNEGLTNEQVQKRISQGLTNKTVKVVGKSTWEIIRTDILSFFNILILLLGILVIFGNVNDPTSGAKWYSGCTFVLIALCNMIITLYQDFKARSLMRKMRLLTCPKARVIRDGKEIEILPSEIVLDDVLLLKSSDQITSDSIILDGEVTVDESLLTGESVEVIKRKGDVVYSGTYITGGYCYTKVERIGKENYIETLSTKAKAFRRNPSEILRDFKKLFRFLGIMIITLIIVIVSTYAIMGSFSTFKGFINMISPLTGQFVAMIPAGLYLLTSLTLASGVVALYKRHANVQDFYSIEMLARADVLCVDKTGTITDGTMVFKEIKTLTKVSEDEIKNIVVNIVESTGDNNLTAVALKNAFGLVNTIPVVKTLPFNSKNKYSGASFKTGMTYILGAVEYINVKDKDKLIKQAEEYTSKGLRVLLLAKSNEVISGKEFNSICTPVGLIVLQDHIKETAKETFGWFEQNSVQIKVISGDNALAVSEIAIEAGIKDAHKYISLEGMSIDEVKAIACDYIVFGRVTPEQKEALVMALQEAGKTVAMTGDGANDMLALKRADCSIAMNSGAAAAKNVSHIVLLTNDFGTMPSIVDEGRRVINNVQRTGSLFLTKTFFAAVLSIGFWIVSMCTGNKYAYPFAPNNLFVWEIFGFGLTAFFISLERNPAPIRKGFLRHILSKAIPSGIVLVLSVLIVYVCYILQKNGLVYTGVSSFGFDTTATRAPRGGATAIAILVFTTLSLMVLYNTCKPLSKYRLCTLIFGILGTAISFLVAAFLPNNIFLIDFNSLTNSNLVLWAAISIILAAVIFFVDPITNFLISSCKKLFRKKENNNENQSCNK